MREVIDKAEGSLKLYGRESFLLLDECHRWSKSQSDSVLPAMESGVIKLIGSTTENPMAAMTSAIVSRCRLFEFYALGKEDIKKAVFRAAEDKERGFGNMDLTVDGDAAEHWASVSNGDVRSALNALELAVLTTKPDAKGRVHITLEIAEQSIQQRAVRMDDNEYYDMLSAFCKSLRGSDSDAAPFWFARMVYAGVDPRVPVRRMIAHASEDVGSRTQASSTSASRQCRRSRFNGMPEARLNIAQAIIYLCESPKSNSVLLAVDAAAKAAREASRQDVPALSSGREF